MYFIYQILFDVPDFYCFCLVFYYTRIKEVLIYIYFYFQDNDERELLESNASNEAVKKQIEELKTLMEKEVKPILQAVHEASQDLNGVIIDIDDKKKSFAEERDRMVSDMQRLPGHCLNDQLLAHSLSLGSWNFDSCGNFTDDCLEAAKLVMNGSIVVVKIGFTSASIVTDVINCPSWNVFRAYKCYKRNVEEVKDLINYAKRQGLPLIEKASSLANRLRSDFKVCFRRTSQLKTNFQVHLSLTNC